MRMRVRKVAAFIFLEWVAYCAHLENSVRALVDAFRKLGRKI